jgi:hypothetical protein
MNNPAAAVAAFLLAAAQAHDVQAEEAKFDIANSGPAAAPVLRNTQNHRIEFHSGASTAPVVVQLGVGSSTFNRPMNCSDLSTTGTAAPFETVTVRNTGVNSATLKVRLGVAEAPHQICRSPIDTVLAVYRDFFVPASPLSNCIAVNDDADDAQDRCSSIDRLEVKPGESLVFVLTTFHSKQAMASSQPMRYALSLEGSVPVTLQSFDIE